MFDKDQSYEIAQKRLSEIQNGCPVAIAINPNITDNTDLGYVFYYNTVEYWETKDMIYSLAGNGPLLVVRDSGLVIDLPAHQSVRKSIEELVDGQRSSDNTQ